MIRPAAADDLAALRAFLAARIETAMFPLGNFRLDLQEMPDSDAIHRAPVHADRHVLTRWFTACLITISIMPPNATQGRAHRRAKAATIGHDHRLLIDAGQPVGMAARDARAAHAVQVGGDFVPPHVRGVGRAGAVVAAMLVRGVRLAIVFAASLAAAPAYARIGFRAIGRYHLTRLSTPILSGPVLLGSQP